MRIDLNAQALNGLENAPGNTPAVGKTASDIGGRADTAQFLFDRVKALALAPEPAPRIEAGKLRIDALRKVLADGSYHVPPELIAGAIVAEARV